MSSRREVLIRILALLQRKTLIKPKNRTLKCLKRHYLTVRSIENVAVLTKDGTFAPFFRPHPVGFDNLRVSTPGNLPSKTKKMLMPGGQPGGGRGWAQVELSDAVATKVSFRVALEEILKNCIFSICFIYSSHVIKV